MTKKNNLGIFNSLDEVYAQYPEGGYEGDYLAINGETYHWDDLNRLWVTDAASPENTIENLTVDKIITAGDKVKTKRIKSLDGTVEIEDPLMIPQGIVAGDLVVCGTLKASHIKQPYCGLFENIDRLLEAYPHPSVGMWAVIGNSIPGDIWVCKIDGKWEATGETGGGGDSSFYVTKPELKSTNDRVERLEQEVFPLNVSFTSDKYVVQCRTTTPVTLSWRVMHRGQNVTASCQYKLNGSPVTPLGTSTKEIEIEATDSEGSFIQTLETKYNKINPAMTFTNTTKVVIVSVYKSFFGAINADVVINESNIEQILTSKLNKNRSFSVSGINLNNQRICFAYPKSFGELTSIKDGNNFENISSYDKAEITFDGVPYYVYTTYSPATASNITQKYM